MIDLIKVMKVLNTEELAKVKKYVEEATYSMSDRYGSRETVQKSVVEDESEVAKMLDSRIKEVVRSYEKLLAESNVYYNKMYRFRTPKILREDYNIIKYDVPQHSPWHVDACTDLWTLVSMGERRLSVILYVNDDFVEGGTQFIGCTYKPSPGYAIVFPSNESFPHRGTHVLHGSKYVIVTWIHREEVDHVREVLRDKASSNLSKLCDLKFTDIGA